MTVKSYIQLRADAQDFLPDNSTRQISASDVRQRLVDLIDTMEDMDGTKRSFAVHQAGVSSDITSWPITANTVTLVVASDANRNLELIGFTEDVSAPGSQRHPLPKSRMIDFGTGGGGFGTNDESPVYLDFANYAIVNNLPLPWYGDVLLYTTPGGFAKVFDVVFNQGSGQINVLERFSRSQTLPILSQTAHGLTSADVGKPLSDMGTVLDDTSTVQSPIGIIVAVLGADQIQYAPTGASLDIPSALLPGGDAYDPSVSGRYLDWDASAGTYVDDLPLDADPTMPQIAFLNSVGGGVANVTVLSLGGR